ncbi:T9SS type A sorting domain-containing protein [Roseivirga sp. BDSF3-8]|uniref:T9SS type A sorting domain-containing protein n=1 Tax=Roseivirga sp. BDSF3-8 TaxID=3241598 RepID=UPI003531E2C2
MKRLLLSVLVFSALALLGPGIAEACHNDDPPPPPPSAGEISGGSSICRGDIRTYSISTSNTTGGNIRYEWSVGIGQVRNPATGQFAGTGVPVVINTTSTSSSVQVRVSDPTPPNNEAVIAVQVSGGGISSAGRLKTVVVNPETTPATPSSITENFFPSTTFNNSFTVSAVSGATSYQWETVPATQNPTGRTVSFFFPGAGFYTIKARAVGCAGNSAFRSINVFIEENNCNQDPFEPTPIFCDQFRTGDDVEDGLANTSVQFDVFPNPLSGNEFTVQIPANVDNAEIIVTDIKGAMVKQLKMSESRLKVDARDMQEGIYLIRVRGDDFNEVRKLVMSDR